MTRRFGPARAPFAVGDAEALVAFCAAQRSPYDERLLKLLLLELTSDPAGVFVIRDDGGIVLAATVVDRAPNGAGAASLETLGVRAPLPTAIFARLVVEPAVAFVRAGACRALHVALPPARLPADGAERALRDAGFAHAPRHLRDAAPGVGARGAARSAAASGCLVVGGARRRARRRGARGARGDISRRAVGEPDAARRFSPGRDLGRVPVARAAGRRAGSPAWCARCRTATAASCASSAACPPIAGAAWARAWSPRGCACWLKPGRGDVDLQVEADNERALDLYRRFGFEVVARTPVFALALRG